ncbi:DUF6090 family protein [Algoriphagus halophilus]|nr:DUF6090 family protein [Algoriphagus halophilus]
MVVLEILIALEVNTWNENRKLKNQKAILIENLRQDYQENLNCLDRIF